jgi:hypothetical protein
LVDFTVVLLALYRMSGVPSAFMRVLLDADDVLVMPEGVVMVLDLLIEPELLVIVLDLVMPAGFCVVLDFTVVFAPGWVVLMVVIFVELLLDVAGGAACDGTAVWARAAVPPNKLRERRKPRMRFMLRK